MRVDVRVDDAGARAALSRAPEMVERALEAALQRSAGMMRQAAQEKLDGTQGFGTLRNSLLERRIEPLHWRVATGTNYARSVEEGTGPAAGKKKYYPNPDSLRDWLMTNPRYRGHSWARAGSEKRGNQELDIWLRSRAWAWGIYQKGTKAHPYMTPAFEENKAAAQAMASAAVRKAVAAINGGGNAGATA